MFQRFKFVTFVVVVFVLYGLTRGDLGSIRSLTTDTSYLAVQLAEVSRLEKEMLKFRSDAEAYVRGDEATSLDEVKTSFEILRSCVSTEAARPVDPRIKTTQKYRPELARLGQSLAGVDALVQSLSRHDTVALAIIESVIQDSAPAMSEMNRESYSELSQTSADLAVLQREAFYSLERVQWVLVTFGLCGFIALLWQLRKGERLYGELQKREAEIRVLASIDPLTGLHNRRHFDERMSTIDDGLWPEDVQLLLIDLDGFKQVNDRHGHEAGDQVLRDVSARLRKSVDHRTVLARLGGDEFGVLFAGTLDQARDIAASIIEALHPPVIVSGKPLKIGSSIGISSRLPGPKNAAAMLREADKALYCAKTGGRNRYAVFENDMPRSGGRRSAA